MGVVNNNLQNQFEILRAKDQTSQERIMSLEQGLSVLKEKIPTMIFQLEKTLLQPSQNANFRLTEYNHKLS